MQVLAVFVMKSNVSFIKISIFNFDYSIFSDIAHISSIFKVSSMSLYDLDHRCGYYQEALLKGEVDTGLKGIENDP